MRVTGSTASLTLLALLAFAFNSILTRLALGAREIDAAAFAAIRLGAGAAMLALIVLLHTRSAGLLRPNGFRGPLALLAYALPFSFAYLRIPAAVGALVLFGVVQLTMLGYAIARGDRPTPLSWFGMLLAFGGLGWLAAPSIDCPDPIGLLLMSVAGIAWAVYSIVGRSASQPVIENARSFLWCSPLALVLAFAVPSTTTATTRGVLLAIVSGAITSGIGYAIWYRAVTGLTVLQAAVAQLTVPVLAAIAAVLLLGETISLRLIACGIAILAGVAIVLVARQRAS
jgi:drug/metabolite transporter (DMT)-like permease